MQNLHLFSIKNKIDLESNHNLFKSNLFYECSFVVNNKIILFNNKNCFLKFRQLKKFRLLSKSILFLTENKCKFCMFNTNYYLINLHDIILIGRFSWIFSNT